MARLEGEMFDGLAVHPRTSQTELFFDLGGRITVRWPRAEAPAGEGELWSLHSRSRFVAVYAGGKYDTGPLSRAATNLAPMGASDWLVIARDAQRHRRILGKLLHAAG